MIEKLISINNMLLKKYENDVKLTERHELIGKILKTPNAFLNISIEKAYAILRDLGLSETEVKNVYLELIEPKL